MKLNLKYLYLWSGLAVGLALIGVSLAYGEYSGGIAGGAWSAVCVGRLLMARSGIKISASESLITWFLHQRRMRRGRPPGH